MSELTKEHIERIRDILLSIDRSPLPFFSTNRLCDAALRGIKANAVKHDFSASEYLLAMACVRQKTGLVDDPLLSDLENIFASKLAAKDAQIEELEAALLGCKLLEIDRAMIAAKE